MSEYFKDPIWTPIAKALNERLDDPLDPDIIAGMIVKVGEQELWDLAVGPALDKIGARLGLESPEEIFERRTGGVTWAFSQKRITEYINANGEDGKVILNDTYENTVDYVNHMRKEGWSF
jgi:hypothetical protein